MLAPAFWLTYSLSRHTRATPVSPLPSVTNDLSHLSIRACELMGKANRNLSKCGYFLLTRLQAVPRFGGISTSSVRLQGRTPMPNSSHCLIRRRWAAFLVGPLSPHQKFILSNVNQSLAQSGGLGGALLRPGLSPGGTPSSGPEDAQLAPGLNGRMRPVLLTPSYC